jgi:short-subunit dehydrogenase
MIKTNVEAFTALMCWGYNCFKSKGKGQIAAITSVAGLFGGCTAYSASKAYQITYIDALRKQAKKECLNLTITEIRPGSVDTAMMKGEGHFWISQPKEAAKLACKAIFKKKKLQYVSSRWLIIGTLLRIAALWK